MKLQIEDKIGREADVGEDEVYSNGELNNPNIEVIEKKRNIVIRIIDVTSVAEKATLHKIVKPKI